MNDVVPVDMTKDDPHASIPKYILEAIQAVCREKGVVIGLRPVSIFAKTFLLLDFPTKDFGIDNKTAKLGICAGMIPINPKYGTADKNGYEEYHKQLKDAQDADNDVKPIPLILPVGRKDELKKLLGDAIEITEIDEGYEVKWLNQNNEECKARAIYNNDERDELRILDDQNEPILVLGRECMQQYLPITADIDLLVVCPNWSTMDPAANQPPIRVQDPNIAKTKEIASNPSATDPREDPRGGNWTELIKDIVFQINEKAGKVVAHHNAEFNNPHASELKKNMPVLLFLPEKIISNSPTTKIQELPDLVEIKSVEALKEVREVVTQIFYWNMHAQYRLEMSRDLSKSRDQVLRQMLDSRKPVSEASASGQTNSVDNSSVQAMRVIKDGLLELKVKDAASSNNQTPTVPDITVTDTEGVTTVYK